MKCWLKYLSFALVSMVCLHAAADNSQPLDTVYFYDSWESMLDMQPSASLVGPDIETLTPFQVSITTGDNRINKMIENDHIAATLGDSIWLINSQYVRDNFSGDVSKLRDYIPVFFNEKVAFLTFAGYGDNFSLKTILFGDYMDEDDFSEFMNYYYIDFQNQMVYRITPNVLSMLLEDYHDLQMRYEGMKDYKKKYIIEDFFFRYVDRCTQDVLRPYILDIVD